MPEFGLFKNSKKRDTCNTCGCSDFKTEFAGDIADLGSYSSKGIDVSTAGDNLRVVYSGLLAKNGAKNVFAVASYGDNKNWSDTQYIEMYNVGGNKFEAIIPQKYNQNLNVVFKDGADNWDNNSGKNYSFNVH